MKTNMKILAIGALLLIAGLITTTMSYEPSQALQYVFIVMAGAVGVLGVAIGRQVKENFVRSKYYTFMGMILVAFAVSLGIWATTVTAFISVVGFFLILLGIVEFVFAQQIFVYQEPIPWAIAGVKLLISVVSATGGAWILTMADKNMNVALLFLGVLFVIIGFAFTQLSRMTKGNELAIETAGL